MEYFAHSQKEFVYKYVVMASDTDKFEHMSFANYLKLMFLTTDALFISCLERDFLLKNRLQLKASRFQFKRQTSVGENILIKVNATSVAQCSFVLLYTFVIEGTAEIVGLGRQEYMIASVQARKLQSIPENMASILKPINVDEEFLLYQY